MRSVFKIDHITVFLYFAPQLLFVGTSDPVNLLALLEEDEYRHDFRLAAFNQGVRFNVFDVYLEEEDVLKLI